MKGRIRSRRRSGGSENLVSTMLRGVSEGLRSGDSFNPSHLKICARAGVVRRRRVYSGLGCASALQGLLAAYFTSFSAFTSLAATAIIEACRIIAMYRLEDKCLGTVADVYMLSNLSPNIEQCEQKV